LVGRVVDGLAGAESAVVHLVNQKGHDKGLAFHSINVMVLSLLLGKAMNLAAEEMKVLGVGALLHDAGKAEIPARILRAAKRTGPEEEFYRAHVGYGIKVTAGMKELPVAAKNIIACHHECWDGSGFPNRLAGEKIPRLSRLVAIANRYDNLCNPLDIKAAKTPAETMQHLFKKEGSLFEPDFLQRFIKALGVYPPGTFISLSNGTIGLVIESNPANLLQPLVMVYDPEIPRQEALLLNLEDADLAVEAVLSPATLPLEAVEYLAPRGRVDYYVEGAS
jgi:HD-GYP domain-containing protein (c-di-GMP phosphodiesterase class II)